MPGIGELLIILTILGGTAFWIWILVDCITKEPSGTSKTVWIVLIAIFGWIAGLIYLVFRRPIRKREWGQ
jgi:hypothetical protein